MESTDPQPTSPAPSQETTGSSAHETFDVFHWANEVDEYKNNVTVELFLFNRNYTPYKVRYSDKLTSNVKSVFMQEAISYIIKEADKGLECHEYEKADGEDKVIYRTKLDRVTRAETLLNLIEQDYKDLDYFSDNEYEFKKIKGILAKFSYASSEGMKSFYITKLLSASSALKGASSWELNGESFEPFSAEVGLRAPDDNQVAIVDDNVIIFSQTKFETLFQYNYKSQVLAEAKARELKEKYKLSFAEGLTLDSLLADRKPLLKKLQNLDISSAMSQDELIDYADEVQLELMTDDDGAIIIMDDKDLSMFINLLNEDYFVSPITHERYEIKGKKILAAAEGEPPRGAEE